jgi:hypothetical protein
MPEQWLASPSLFAQQEWESTRLVLLACVLHCGTETPETVSDVRYISSSIW